MDKDVNGVARAMADTVDLWYTVSLAGPRGFSAQRLAEELAGAGIPRVTPCNSVADALGSAEERATPGDRIVVFGSFLWVIQDFICLIYILKLSFSLFIARIKSFWCLVPSI